MGNFEILDPKRHKDLCVNDGRGSQYGDQIMYSLAYPFEFRALQAEYPLLFKKSEESGQFQAIALFGLAPEENLYLSDAVWQARTLPLSIRREPFLLAERRIEASDITQDFVVSINMDHPRVQLPGGQPLFLADHSPTPYLQEILGHLRAMREGYQQSQQFFTALEQNRLITPITINIPLQEALELSGFYSIDEARLSELDPESRQTLARDGWLESAYMQLASLSQMSGLIQRKLKSTASERPS